MDEELDIDFTAKLCFLNGIPFTKPDKYKNLNKYYKILWILYAILPLTATAIFFLGALIHVAKNYTDPKTVITFGIFAVYFITFAWKLSVIVFNPGEYDKIYSEIRSLAAEFSGRKDGYDEIHKFYYAPVKKFGKFNICMIVFTSFAYNIGLSFWSQFMRKEDRALPIHIWTPYDAFENPAFSLTTMYEGVAGSFCVVRNTIVDFIPLTIVTVPAAQLKYLSNVLEDLFERDTEDFEEKFKWWIECHKKVLKSMDDFKNLCSYNLSFTYGGAMIDLFLVGMAVTTPNLDWDIFKLLVIMGNLIVPALQLFISCYVADVLKNALSTVNGALSPKLIYSTKLVKSSFVFATLRSNKPIRFTVAGLYPLSAETFRDMVRVTVTYFVTIVQIRSRFSGN